MLFLLSTADHSFFGSEWQKRWCALSSNTFYYYGNEKGITFMLFFLTINFNY
jgi:hypothetical protein